MEVRTIIRSVSVTSLAAQCGIPKRTLQRWADENRIPGTEGRQRSLFEMVKKAAAKLPKRDEAA